jgi:PHD/YefM family antitoxin component YafN of YafNO toxin-antitoxin module
MGKVVDLLKAQRVGARALRLGLSRFLKSDSPLVITEHGQPARVMLAYDAMMDLLDMVDELSDARTVEAIREGRHAIASGVEGVGVNRLFKKLRSNKK